MVPDSVFSFEALTVYEVEPSVTTKYTPTRSVSVIALKVTFEPLGAEFGVAYTKRILSLPITSIRQVAAPLEV